MVQCPKGGDEHFLVDNQRKGRSPLEDPGPMGYLPGGSYSSQASTFTWREISPSRNSSVIAVKTQTPSGYPQASLNATRFSPTTSFSTR